jgi:hypothetical protein
MEIKMSAPRTEGPLSNLPKDMRQEEIYPLSPLSVLGLLAQTSKQYEAETVFSRLLGAAIHAAPEFLDAKEDATALASIAILKKNPELLFKKKKVTDHAGREILASPYQVFLGTGDVWALKQIHKDVLPLIKDEKEQAKMETQFKEQFPHCPWPLPENLNEEMLYDDRNRQQIEEIKKQLATVKELIDNDPFINNEPLGTTKQAVEALCKLFQPTPGEVIKSGLHFPLAIIEEIYKTYDALEVHWSFFSLNVIKPALDALSTVYGQCCQYGLSNLDMKKGPNRRCDSSYKHPLGQPLNLKLVNHKTPRVVRLVDPHDGYVLFDSSSRGYFFDWHNKNGAWCGRGLRLPARGTALAWALENLWRTKAEAYGVIMAATRRKENTLSQ